ncbi:hypothetical protein [Gemmatimonas sp.]|uniref:hypothetical protein n=1 Tax=Gemmatimonas sp. TaxID=1962908 RepID=UPI00356780DD
MTSSAANTLAADVVRARTLLAQFGDTMVVVLMVAALIAGLVGEPEDMIAIIAIVILKAVLGFVQENRTRRYRTAHCRQHSADQSTPARSHAAEHRRGRAHRPNSA